MPIAEKQKPSLLPLFASHVAVNNRTKVKATAVRVATLAGKQIRYAVPLSRWQMVLCCKLVGGAWHIEYLSPLNETKGSGMLLSSCPSWQARPGEELIGAYPHLAVGGAGLHGGAHVVPMETSAWTFVHCNLPNRLFSWFLAFTCASAMTVAIDCVNLGSCNRHILLNIPYCRGYSKCIVIWQH